LGLPVAGSGWASDQFSAEDHEGGGEVGRGHLKGFRRSLEHRGLPKLCPCRGPGTMGKDLRSRQ
jgi:hypothetical protein